jgi:hypothetical protein
MDEEVWNKRERIENERGEKMLIFGIVIFMFVIGIRKPGGQIKHLFIQCVQKAWKHPNKIETNDFREKRKSR